MKIIVPILGVLLVGGVIAVFLFATNIFQSNTSPSIPEYMIITDVQYGVGSDGWVAVTVNNTGIASVTIVKVLINNFKQSLVNPSPPVAVAPDSGVVLNVTMNVTQSGTYKIDLLTSQGNMFSKSSQVPAGQQAGVILYKENVYWNSIEKKTYITIGNSGTSDEKIVRLYLGTSEGNVVNVTAYTNIGTGKILTAKSVLTITLSWPNSVAPTWTAGDYYYFKIVSETGQEVGPFPEQAPQ